MFTMFIHRSSLLKLFPCNSLTLHWDDWGPPITHLVTFPRIARWITVSCGQRFAMLLPLPHNLDQDVTPIVLLDFNPQVIRRVARELRNRPSSSRRMSVLQNLDTAKGREFLLEHVEHHLPAAWFMTVEQFDFNGGLLMDEGVLLGLKVSPMSVSSQNFPDMPYTGQHGRQTD